MPDFERDMLDAADFDGTVRASAFSWSWTREHLFRQCRRACFLRYYLAQGGWDPHAHPLIRSAYMEKYCLPFRVWLARTFQTGINNGFRRAIRLLPDSRKRAFSSACLRQLSKSLFELQFSMENGEYLRDPKMPMLLECRNGGMKNFNELKQYALDSFSTGYAAFVKSDLFRELIQLDIMDFRLDEPILSFPFEQWPVWFAPGLVFFHNGRFSMLTCAAESEPDDPDPDFSITAALFALHIKSKWKKQPSALAFRFSPGHAGLEELHPASRIRSLIRNGSEEMLRSIRPDGRVCCRDFPCTDQKEHCVKCPFTETCRGLCEWEKNFTAGT